MTWLLGTKSKTFEWQLGGGCNQDAEFFERELDAIYKEAKFLDRQLDAGYQEAPSHHPCNVRKRRLPASLDDSLSPTCKCLSQCHIQR